MMTDSSGNKLGEQGHYPFGESLYATNTTSKWQFTSYERDAESGNDYAMARFNVNRLGRFASPDPMGGSAANPQSLNRYTYVQNDPINLIDPFGLTCFFFNADGTLNDTNDMDPGVCLNAGGLPSGGDATVTVNGGSDDPIDPEDPSGPNSIVGGDGGGGGAPSNLGQLVGQALLGLLNKDCASLFGGLTNAVKSLANSSYNMYTPGEANPYPNQISSEVWEMISTNLSGSSNFIGETVWSSSASGGIIFLPSAFSQLDPGFANASDSFTQMTAFYHEQEHAANHSNLLDRLIDSNYPADSAKINANCTPPQIETQRVPLTTDLTPPE